MLTFLPSPDGVVTDNALDAFLGVDERQPDTPPWLRLFKLSQSREWDVRWQFHTKACSQCEACVVYRFDQRLPGVVNDFTMCLNCGHVVARANAPNGKPLRLPVSGRSWAPPDLAIKMLRACVFRRRPVWWPR